jgi:hypothetical protein
MPASVALKPELLTASVSVPASVKVIVGFTCVSSVSDAMPGLEAGVS